MSEVVLYTDGSCLKNPGPGGWAGVLVYQDREREYYGFEADTTNNRMELRAAIEGLRLLKKPVKVIVHTDSQYVRLGITQWLASWVRAGWRKADKKPVKNVDLWQELHQEAKRHDIQWRWVKAHSGIALNERVDQLARAAATHQRTS